MLSEETTEAITTPALTKLHRLRQRNQELVHRALATASKASVARLRRRSDVAEPPVAMEHEHDLSPGLGRLGGDWRWIRSVDPLARSSGTVQWADSDDEDVVGASQSRRHHRARAAAVLSLERRMHMGQALIAPQNASVAAAEDAAARKGAGADSPPALSDDDRDDNDGSSGSKTTRHPAVGGGGGGGGGTPWSDADRRHLRHLASRLYTAPLRPSVSKRTVTTPSQATTTTPGDPGPVAPRTASRVTVGHSPISIIPAPPEAQAAPESAPSSASTSPSADANAERAREDRRHRIMAQAMSPAADARNSLRELIRETKRLAGAATTREAKETEDGGLRDALPGAQAASDAAAAVLASHTRDALGRAAALMFPGRRPASQRTSHPRTPVRASQRSPNDDDEDDNVSPRPVSLSAMRDSTRSAVDWLTSAKEHIDRAATRAAERAGRLEDPIAWRRGSLPSALTEGDDLDVTQEAQAGSDDDT